MLRILLVDDEAGVLAALERVLRRRPPTPDGLPCIVRVDTFEDPHAALACASEVAFELVVSDYHMPGLDGVQLLSRIRRLQPAAARVILSGHADAAGLIGAINEARIDRFLAKPWDDDALSAALCEVLEARARRLEDEQLADQQRHARGTVSLAELELKLLERLEPGITQVQWEPDGSILMDTEEILRSDWPSRS